MSIAYLFIIFLLYKEDFLGGILDLGEKSKYLKSRQVKQLTPKQVKLHNDVIVANTIVRLTKELTKSNYCRFVLNNPPFSIEIHNKKIDLLKRWEKNYPHLVILGSPTKYVGFNEEKAVQVYGKVNWNILKNTMELTVDKILTF